MSRRLGTLAVARYKQEGEYRVRQREQLRRALRKAGLELSWDVLASFRQSPVDAVTVDVRRLTKAGLRAIERDLESEIKEKGQEVRQLKRVVKTLSKLADEGDAAFPVEIEYQYTSSRGKTEYVTKTEELELDSADSAEQAARRLEKRMDRLGRLRDEMVYSLKRKRAVVAEARAEVKDFVRGTRPLIGEVLAVML